MTRNAGSVLVVLLIVVLVCCVGLGVKKEASLTCRLGGRRFLHVLWLRISFLRMAIKVTGRDPDGLQRQAQGVGSMQTKELLMGYGYCVLWCWV